MSEQFIFSKEFDVRAAGNALLNDYKRLQFENDKLTARIAELEEQVWNLNLENERLEEAYWIDETISPDGTLKPSVRKLLERLEKAETDLRLSDDLVKALDNRIAELEAENAELKERVAMLDITAVFKSLGEMGYIEQTNKLHTLIAEIEAECEQLRLGIHDETVPEKYEENVAKLQKEFSMRFENESPVEFYRTIRSGQYPQPPEVQESEATSCEFCGSNKSDRRMNSIVCTSCGRKIGNIAPPEGA